MKKKQINKTMVSTVAVLITVCTVIIGAVGFSGQVGKTAVALSEPVIPETVKLSAGTGFPLTDGEFDLTIIQDNANVIMVSGTAPLGITGNKAMLIVNGGKFTLNTGDDGKVEEQLFYLSPEVFFEKGSTVSVKVGYSVNGVYHETEESLAEVVLFDPETLNFKIPEGTKYLDKKGELKSFTGDGLPEDIYINIVGNATLDYEGKAINVKVYDYNVKEKDTPDPTDVGGEVYDLGGDFVIFTAEEGYEFNLTENGENLFTEYKTPTDGKVSFSGLDAGKTYMLTVRFPEGEKEASAPVEVKPVTTLADPTDKNAFDSLYESLKTKLYSSGTVTVTEEEADGLYDAYNKLTVNVKSLPAVSEKSKDTEISSYLAHHAGVIANTEFSDSDKASIKAALNAFDGLSDECKTELIQIKTKLLGGYRDLAVGTVNSADGMTNASDNVKAKAKEYTDKIKTSTDISKIDTYVTEAISALFGLQKTELIAEIDELYKAVTEGNDYGKFSGTAKEKITKAYSDGKTAVTETLNFSDAMTETEKTKSAITQAETEAKAEVMKIEKEISDNRAAAKKKIDDILTENDSDAVKKTANDAKQAIDTKTLKAEMDAIADKAVSDITAQRAKDEVADHASKLSKAEEGKTDFDIIITRAVNAIDAAVGKAEIELAVTRAKAELDVTEAYYELISSIEANDLKKTEKKTAAKNAYDNAITALENAKTGTEVAGALEAELDNIGKCLDKIKDDPVVDYSKLFDDYKSEIISELEAFKNGNEKSDAKVDAGKNEISGVKYEKLSEGTDPETYLSGLKAELDGIYNRVKDEVELLWSVKAAEELLKADAEAKKNSGLYSEVQKNELDAVLLAAIENLENLTEADDIEGVRTAGIKALGEVKVVTVKTDPSSDYKANVKNDNGLNSNITLIIKDASEKQSIDGSAYKRGSFAVVTGNMSSDEAKEAIKDKKVFLALDIDLKSDGAEISGEGNGTYTVDIELPIELELVSGIQVVSEDAEGKIQIYDTKVENGHLIFTTTHFSEYIVLGDSTLDLTWLIVLFGIIIAAELVTSAVFVIITKKKKNEIKTMIFVPFLAVILAPAGFIPAIVIMGACVIGGGIAVGVTGNALKKVNKVLNEKNADINKSKKENTPENNGEEQKKTDMTGEIRKSGDKGDDDTETTDDMAEEETDSDGNTVVLAEDAEEDDSEDKKVFIGSSGNRIYVSYSYSFESKLMLASEDVQRRYYTLSQLLRSYKTNESRSWKKERYSLNGKTYVYMIFRGKTLCLCMSIAPESLDGTKYFYENVGKIKKYESTPVMLRIRSGRACKNACELIDMMFEAAGIEQKCEPEDNFVPTKPAEKQYLIECGYVKAMVTDDNGVEKVGGDLGSMKNEFDIVDGGMPLMKRITAEAVAGIPDEEAAPFVETETDSDRSFGRRKGIVNVDSISDAFDNGEEVTLGTLKAKHLIPKNVQFVKVIARGTLDKSLTVKLHDFSMDAVKMIIIAGGKVVKLKSEKI